MCTIGQNTRCCVTGCEILKHFGAHCHGEKIKNVIIPTYDEFLKQKHRKQTVKRKPQFELVNEDGNLFKTAKQDDWIKKIKVKL